ncbi:undecaprenyl-diphosphate phosphatase [Pararobbsia alpina]|uniref:Undecaprenyl-diphosphatase n=1 Tax=Pararobbsia alpina TaxID=621374 RepID=A0A6S7CK52_9BURK|nr:undecaprenyl-diphosphate phosphatase [Pararobbsia alpina]CAB3781874.1 Undecaprenyl-diphosphatase [Pararobbsia alpina]
MLLPEPANALILGIVEGLTEFIPVSSTGHLIVVGSLLGMHGDLANMFDIVIQLGAILAVCWEFRRKLISTVVGLPSSGEARRFALNVIIACVPAGILGLLLGKSIQQVLFAPMPVAIALFVGGIVILIVERHNRNLVLARQSEDLRGTGARVTSINQMSGLDAVKVGFAQCFALIPGTSRSGATIIGGMMFGLDRKVATEFSFYVAIPLLFAATLYELLKARAALTSDSAVMLIIGLVAAFVSGLICVRWLMRFVSSHDFRAFAWYRIAFGGVILLTAYTGVVEW